MDVEWGGDDESMSATWFEAGGVLGVWERDRYRHHVNVGGGVAVGSGGDDVSSEERLHVRLPLRLDVALGSAHQPLTGLVGGFRFEPTFGTNGLRHRALADLVSRVHIGEFAGANVALGARYSGRMDAFSIVASSPIVHHVEGGLWVERL